MVIWGISHESSAMFLGIELGSYILPAIFGALASPDPREAGGERFCRLIYKGHITTYDNNSTASQQD